MHLHVCDEQQGLYVFTACVHVCMCDACAKRTTDRVPYVHDVRYVMNNKVCMCSRCAICNVRDVMCDV